jgi:ABC-2 type transport system permease protein
VTATEDSPTNVIAPERSVAGPLADVWTYRELLGNLVRKELKVKYKNSVLGFFWSLLNPISQVIVFTVVFQIVLKNTIPFFPVFLLSGMLAWNLFALSAAGATGSITGNHQLVNKVYFPREILPLSAVGANCVHFLLQSLVLLATISVTGIGFDWRWVWLVIPALIVLLILTSAFGIFLSAVNVYARDTQHLLDVVLMAWMWVTPLIYQWRLPAEKLHEHGIPASFILVNPLVAVTVTLQRALYQQHFVQYGSDPHSPMLPTNGQWWYLRNLGIVGAFGVLAFVLAMRLFHRLEGNFAEEL